MPLVRGGIASDYAVIVFRSWLRPNAQLYPFAVRDGVPPIPVPLRRDEPELTLALGEILHQLYDRAGYDLRVDYTRPPEPPLTPDAAAWAQEVLSSRRG